MYQSSKIYSYDLIGRYMSGEEVAARLRKMVADRVEPRRWCLAMVDEIYCRLKDRYRATDA